LEDYLANEVPACQYFFPDSLSSLEVEESEEEELQPINHWE
jgi:hypothetical protein